MNPSENLAPNTKYDTPATLVDSLLRPANAVSTYGAALAISGKWECDNCAQHPYIGS